MCYAVWCRICGKTTWAGCGLHVDAVKRTVPATQWCGGHPDNKSSQPLRSFPMKTKWREKVECMTKKKLVILGAGIGGLSVLKELAESGVSLDDLDITVVDK